MYVKEALEWVYQETKECKRLYDLAERNHWPVVLEQAQAKLRDDGTPIACPHYLGFPAMANVCFQPTQCADCWSRPAPEE